MNDEIRSDGLFEKMMQTVWEVIATGLPSRVVVSAEGQDQDLAYLYVVREDAGFTWDDVDRLRAANDSLAGGWFDAPGGLIERIAALLPPRA